MGDNDRIVVHGYDGADVAVNLVSFGLAASLPLDGRGLSPGSLPFMAAVGLILLWVDRKRGVEASWSGPFCDRDCDGLRGVVAGPHHFLALQSALTGCNVSRVEIRHT